MRLLAAFFCGLVARMKLRFWRYELKLAHEWTIAREWKPDGTGGTRAEEVVFVELTDRDGVTGFGEASPSARYGETPDIVKLS